MEEYFQIKKITFHPVGYEAIMVSLVDYYDVPLYLPIKADVQNFIFILAHQL